MYLPKSGVHTRREDCRTPGKWQRQFFLLNHDDGPLTITSTRTACRHTRIAYKSYMITRAIRNKWHEIRNNEFLQLLEVSYLKI